MSAERVFDRLVDSVTLTESGCWVSSLGLDQYGYGRVRVPGGRQMGSHRFAYEFFREPIPSGLQIDHLCRVRNCVNPWHMEVVSNRENFIRGDAPTAVLFRKNVCKHGHSLMDAYTNRVRGRDCRTCTSIRAKERRAAKKREAMSTNKGMESSLSSSLQSSSSLRLHRRRTP